MKKKYKKLPEIQQLKKHQRLQFLTKNDFNPETGEFIERKKKKVNGETWRLQITTTHVKDFLWLASRAKNKLSYLRIMGCQVDSWSGLQQLKELRVLDISQVDLSGGLPEEIAPLAEMRALIISECQLPALEHIEGFLKLNTLAINRNALTRIPECVGTFTELEKLALSSNQLKGKYLPDLSGCTALKQIRLSHNEKLKSLPAHFESWTKGGGSESKLECLYLASSGVKSDETLDQIFEHSSSLSELAISNTPLVKGNEAQYDEKCKAALPKLKIYNTVRFDELYQHRKEATDRRQLREMRKQERLARKDRQMAHVIQELRLLNADKPAKPEKPPLSEEAAAELAEKKRIKRERKKEKQIAEIELRKGDRERAGLPPLPELPPGVSKFSRKSQLPPKAERKARKERKRAERSHRKFEQRQQTRLVRAAKAAKKEGTAIVPAITDGTDQFAGNGDFVAFDDAAPKPKKRKLESASVDDASAPSESSKKSKREHASSEGVDGGKPKKRKREQPAEAPPETNGTTRHREKKPKSTVGSLAADDSSSRPAPMPDNDKPTSVVGIVDVAPAKRKKKKESADVGAFLANGDAMGGVQQW